VSAARAPGACGVLVVDKPRGPTSHDVVARIRRIFKTREVGHAGTLDPMATGVLVLALGEATKLVPYLTNAAKVYEARLELGRETDTLDAMGRVTEERALDAGLLEALDAGVSPLAPRIAGAVAAELARTSQEPPRFSAIQENGERAHARARRGESFVLEERAVRVHRLVVTAMGVAPAPWLALRVKADKGYYVRSLGRDLAHALGTVGHLVALRRIDSGGFTVDEACALDVDPEVLRARLLPLAAAARRALPAVTLTELGVREARFGRRVQRADLEGDVPLGAPSAWFDGDGALVAIGILEEDGRVLRGFGEASEVRTSQH
jgi:tRNA pseudouridine55 synthase